MTDRPRTAALVVASTLIALGSLTAQTTDRFEMVEIDTGAAESMAIADVNGDGRLDIVSAGSWYEAPGWTKRSIRTIPVTSGTSTPSAICRSTSTATATSMSSRSATSPGASSGCATPDRAAAHGRST